MFRAAQEVVHDISKTEAMKKVSEVRLISFFNVNLN